MFFELSHQPDHHTAVISDCGNSYTYAQLREQISFWRVQLGNERLLIFLFAENSFDFLAFYLACLQSKHVVMMLNPDLDEQLEHELAESYKPQYIWKKGKPKQIEQSNLTCELHTDLAILLSTSGSTGSPKFVRLSAHNLDANARSIASYLQLNSNERPISSLPPYYSYGLSVINSHLHAGATILLTKYSIFQKQFWAFLKEYEATSFAGVPYMYETLMRMRFTSMQLPSLKTLTQAGGKLNAQHVLAFATWAQETQKRFFVMYGQTEATARMSYLPSSVTLQKSSSVGIAIPMGKFSLQAAQGELITEAHCEGELIYSGPNVAMGYAESLIDLSKGDEWQGKLKTGDIAYRDEDGYYYIVGRLKRFIKLAGNRFGLDSLENNLAKLGIEAICGGCDDLLRIALLKGSQESLVSNYLIEKLNLHPTQFRIESISEVPRSPSGKILYTQIFT